MSVRFSSAELLHWPGLAGGNRFMQDGVADVHGIQWRVRGQVGRVHRLGRANDVRRHEFAVRHGLGRLRWRPQLRNVP
jgi:hypothetical protein